ncbi:hypothetical protein ACIRU8_42460 [Streptomyces sp. NPDC101175]|uniref:hypothetical protein n=1 Tax=Streptomyces sp. NPDC101175 TaxID=3366123 RepID=UPI0038396351
MTADPTTTADQLAGEMIRVRLGDSTFGHRLSERLHTWEADPDAFLSQTESVVLIALLATADASGAATPETWCRSAAAALRQQPAAELFAALPASLPDPVRRQVEHLRLLSAAVTPRSGHRWLRLSDTAAEFLEPAALLEG